MRGRRRGTGQGRSSGLTWPAAALPGLLLAALVATAAGADEGRAPLVEMVVAPATTR